MHQALSTSPPTEAGQLKERKRISPQAVKFWTLVTVVLLHAFVLHFWLQVGVTEDAFITLRVSRNLASGKGPVFNAGERVESYTNPLWMGVIAALGSVGLKPHITAPLLSLLGLLGLAFVGWRLEPRSITPAWLLGLDSMVVALGLSGLETTVFTLLIALGALSVFQEKHVRAGLLLALSTMTRPDGVVYTILIFFLFAVYVLMKGKPGRLSQPMILRFLGSYLAFYLPFFAMRFIYYGYPFPNTYYAKTTIPLSWNLGFGVKYLGHFVTTYWGALLALGILIANYWKEAGKRSSRVPAEAIVLIGAVVGPTAYVVMAGGDNLSVGVRFFLPIIVLVCFLVPRLPNPRLRTVALSLLAINILIHNRSFYLQQVDWLEKSLPGNYQTIGLSFKRSFPETARIALQPIGKIGYFSELPLIDLHGLADEDIAHHGPLGDKRLGKGHVKIGYLLALRKKPEAFWFQQIIPEGKPLDEVVFPFGNRLLIELLEEKAFIESYQPAGLDLIPGVETIVFLRNDFQHRLAADEKSGPGWRFF